MDKKIVDKLIQFGLITNVGVDANKYTDVDDLIAKGIITVPGAKTKIMELIGDDSIVVEEDVAEATVEETPVEEKVVEPVVDVPVEGESAEPETEVVVEEAAETVETTEAKTEVVAEEDVAEATVDETPTKSEKKSGKSTKISKS